jgi:hypothetical protein
LLDDGEGYAGRALGRLEELCALARASDVTAAHFPAALNYAFLLAAVGRLDDAAAQVADGTAQARRERNAMALDMWATLDGMIHLAAGRLSAARAATESLPPPERTGVTPLDMIRIVILAEVATCCSFAAAVRRGTGRAQGMSPNCVWRSKYTAAS